MRKDPMGATPIRRTHVCTAVLVALGTGSFSALAQNAPVSLEPVVVVGQAAATDRALNDQERANDIRSVVRGDGIGRLPDKNAAEALQRLTGVSIERDQGEGRYVRVRGLGPDLNAVTINGSLVPSPERDRRGVMLDVLPASLIGSLEVIKSLTPDMDANSIGGTINVKSLSAFDVPGRLLSADVGGSYSDNTSQSSPYGALLWTDKFAGGALGVALGLNAERRRFGSDNVETGGAWDREDLEEFERRDYRITRDRLGAALNVEFRPQQGTEYYVRSMVSRFKDAEVRQAHIVEFADPQAPGALGDAESARELKDRTETQTIGSLVLGTRQSFGDWRLNVEAGFSRAQEDTPQHVAAAVFDGGDFANVGFVDTRKPRLIAPEAINAPGSYELDEIELERTLVKDRERNARVDVARSLDFFGEPAEFKFGTKMSRRTRTNEQTTWILEDFEDPPFGLAANQTSLTSYSGPSPKYPLGEFGPSIGSGGLRAIYGGLDLSGFVDDEESTINNFKMNEDINAAYGQLRFNVADWRIIGGLRVEETKFKAAGTGIEDGTFVPSNTERTRRHWLPGLHLRRNLDNATVVRAAWWNSLVRPTFGQLEPGFAIDGDEAEFGNPSLDPLKSSNFDFGAERRLGFAGVLSAYAFYKRIKDFTYQTDLAGTGRWASFSEAVTFANGDRAKVYGAEIAYSQSMRSLLPAPWSALLFGLNATYSKSDATISRFDSDVGAVRSRSLPLPSQSDWILNAVLGYETEQISARLAANYKSRYLLEVVDVLDANRDQFVDGQTQLDLSIRLTPMKSLQLSFEVLNLTDESYYTFSGTSSRNAQWETYGRTFRIGVKYIID